MICAPEFGFVLLCLPKAGSTTLQEALTPRAQVVFRDPLKHIHTKDFERKIQPLLAGFGYPRDRYEVVTMFREPVEWLDSWHRYRSRDKLKGRPNYAGDMSFAEFAEAYLASFEPGARKGPASVGRPARFISSDWRTTVGVDRIFALDRPDVWKPWFKSRTQGRVSFVTTNRSKVAREGGPELPPALDARLREFFAPEYAVWRRLADTGMWAGARGTDLANG